MTESNNLEYLTQIHEVQSLAAATIDRLNALDEEYAQSPDENLDKRLTINRIIMVIRIQSDLIRRLVEADQMTHEELTRIMETFDNT